MVLKGGSDVKQTCKDCTDRRLGCHAKCHKYIEAKILNEFDLEAKRRDKDYIRNEKPKRKTMLSTHKVRRVEI